MFTCAPLGTHSTGNNIAHDSLISAPVENEKRKRKRKKKNIEEEGSGGGRNISRRMILYARAKEPFSAPRYKVPLGCIPVTVNVNLRRIAIQNSGIVCMTLLHTCRFITLNAVSFSLFLSLARSFIHSLTHSLGLSLFLSRSRPLSLFPPLSRHVHLP